MQNIANRAGQYIRQPQNYNAFIPADLPPNPRIEMNTSMYNLLSKADIALGRLDGVTELLPARDIFIKMYAKKEATLSSNIEGSQASLSDVLSADTKKMSPKKRSDIQEVDNYVNAIYYGIDRLPELPISLRLIKEIHSILMQNARGHHLTPGEFRTSQNWIGSPGCTLGQASFVPPPPHEMIHAMGNWEKYVHDEKEDVPYLVKIAMLHSQFETIHPFLDGNGRVGRLLITFLLCWKGVLRWPALYLSAYFLQHQTEYYTRLDNVHNKGDWEGWVTFFLQGVCDVAREATATARDIIQLRENHRKLALDKLNGSVATNACKLLDILYESPNITSTTVASKLEVTASTANNLLTNMEKLGILDETTGGERYRSYRYTSYIDLFETLKYEIKD